MRRRKTLRKRTFRRRRNNFRRRRITRKRSQWDGGYKCLAEQRGVITGNGTGINTINVSWGTNGGTAGLIQPIAMQEPANFVTRFREYCIIGFTIEINLINR